MLELKKQQKKKNKKKAEANTTTEGADQESSTNTNANIEDKGSNLESTTAENKVVVVADDEIVEKSKDLTKESLAGPKTSVPSETIEKQIKELEEKLKAANLTIEKLNGDVSEYKDQLESRSVEKQDTPDSENSSDENSTPIEEQSKLNSTIESLKIENTFLNDKVYSLEARIANLINMNKKRSIDFPNRDTSDLDSDIGSLNSPILDPGESTGRSISGGQHPRLASFVDMDLYGDINKIKDINKDMERWKGWNVDMRSWRSLGVGPAFDI